MPPSGPCGTPLAATPLLWCAPCTGRLYGEPPSPPRARGFSARRPSENKRSEGGRRDAKANARAPHARLNPRCYG